MGSFTKTYIIEAPVAKVWQALTDPDMIDAWGGGPTTMSTKVGADFEFGGGDIWGKNIEIISHKQIKQEWFGGEWDQPSIVTFDLSGSGKQTTVVVTHEDVPDSEKADLEDGWQKYYFGPIKKLLEK